MWTTTSFTYYCRRSFTSNIHPFRLSSAAIRKWKVGQFYFWLLIDVVRNDQVPFRVQPCVYLSKQIFSQWRNVSALPNQDSKKKKKQFIDYISDVSTRASEIITSCRKHFVKNPTNFSISPQSVTNNLVRGDIESYMNFVQSISKASYFHLNCKVPIFNYLASAP